MKIKIGLSLIILLSIITNGITAQYITERNRITEVVQDYVDGEWKIIGIVWDNVTVE